MTGIDRRDNTPMGPPWPVDVLADLHAGVLDDALSEQLWAKVRSDPEASAVLDSLDATQAELTGFANQPPPPMPTHFAARLDAAIAAEAAAMTALPSQRQHAGPAPMPHPARQFNQTQQFDQAQQFDSAQQFNQAQQNFAQPRPAPPNQGAPVVDLAAARAKRNRRMGWGAGVLVAAAAAVAVAVIAIPHAGTSSPGIAEPGPSAGSGATGGGAPLALTSGHLTAATASSALGRSDYGPLADPAKRSACLAANGQDADRTPAGAMQVTLNGEPGVLMVLTTGKLAQFRLLVVGPDCAAGHPDTLANTVIGGPRVTPTR
jgi:hypothetical protein